MIPYTISFKNEHTIQETSVQCTVHEDEFNMSYNPSLLTDKLNHSSSLVDFATGSEFTPYSTGLGLYDDDGNLLAVGKFGKPVPMSKKTDMNFVLKFDTSHISKKNYLDLDGNGNPKLTTTTGGFRGVGYSDLQERLDDILRQAALCPKAKTLPIDPYTVPVKVSNSTATC